jgi:hypothetical protein
MFSILLFFAAFILFDIKGFVLFLVAYFIVRSLLD